MSITNEAKNNISVINEVKSGLAWNYDRGGGFTYDNQYDPITGMPVFYDGIGTALVITNEAKNSVAFTGESKNNI